MGLEDTNPHDPEAEKAVIGDMYNMPEVIGEIAPSLTATDFFDGRCGVLYTALVDDWRHGRVSDPVTSADVVRSAGYLPDARWLHEVMTSGSGAWKAHVEIVLAMHARRQLLVAVSQAQASARTPEDPWEVIDSLTGSLTRIVNPVAGPPPGLQSIDELLDHPDTDEPDWIVEGLLRRDWRCVVVGTEGGGKSMLFRQFAVLAAQGVHPLRFQPMTPVRVLLVDLENPEGNVRRACRSLRDGIKPSDYEFDRAWLWHRPAGIDIRSRSGRGALEAAIAAVRPDLLALGPLYKAYRRRPRETDEDAVIDVQAIFDDLRTRYGCALLLEHHAGQDTAGVRKLRPYGSSLWLRWPELGLAMAPNDRASKHRKSVTLERWRGDRMSNDWPTYLDQGDRWPWLGVWAGQQNHDEPEW